jgi:hypothetical protein
VRVTAVLAAAALAAAFVPVPAEFVEAWYSRGFYLRLQPAVTAASSVVPFALLDVVSVCAAVALVALVARRWRAGGGRAALRALGLALVGGASIVYVLFVALWGLNYRRVPLEKKLAYDAARVTREGIIRLAEVAVDQVNLLEPRKTAVDSADRVALERAFAETQRRMGMTRTARPAAPKHSLVSWYLRAAGIDGMMNPLFLEIILNPEVLPVERPFALAHEWAHLAGHANEAEANFMAWLTCVSGDATAQYSGWLEAYRYAAAALPRDDRRGLQQRLAPGVIADLVAINARLGRADPAVSGFARNVYDSYLKSQGVEEGLASYGAMLRLMAGTTFENGWVPRLR